jgi:hypothetical protein
MTRRLRFLPVMASAWLLLSSAAPADDAPGIRQITSEHLTLYTDLPADVEVDALPGYFDQAFDQWCAYFGVDPGQHADWRASGYLMRSPERFRAAGLLGTDVPDFASGYSRGREMWLRDQSSTYYRRHLLLHEGTHSFMHTLAGGVGPPWLAEGMAECLATHRLEDGKLALGDFPGTREQVSKWGRIEAVQSGYAAQGAKTLAQIFAYGGTLHGDVESYGWCWAAAAFLDGHPRYRERFRQLHRDLAEPDFAARVEQTFARDRARLDEDWQLFVANIDYGYDFARMEVERREGAPLAPRGESVTVAADRGWQSSGVALAPGRYRLRAGGRYQVAGGEPPWMSEPGGVTIEYYRGRPLGILLAAVRDDDAGAGGSSGLLAPIVVGLGTTLVVERPGTLYLRINDSPGALADNAGSAAVEVAKE